MVSGKEQKLGSNTIILVKLLELNCGPRVFNVGASLIALFRARSSSVFKIEDRFQNALRDVHRGGC